MEQGLNLTVIEAPHPFVEDGSPKPTEGYDARKDFYSARREWFGWVPGTDWLHDAIEGEFGEDSFWYDVESRRDATHVGASGEIATVVLVLMGVAAIEFTRTFSGRVGERSADDFYDWVRQLAQNRRAEKGFEHADPAPDFARYDRDFLPERVKAELADVMEIQPERLELVESDERQDLVMFARYRDSESGRDYTAELGRSNVLFRRVGAPEPEMPEPKRRFWQRQR